MYRSDIVDEYREWLLDFIRFDDYCDRYGRLIDYLSTRKFTWSVDHDENRAEDGFALRCRFAADYDYDGFWENRLPKKCSVLEMMIALSMRCEDVVYDPDIGDRTAIWFWEMIWNLGFHNMTNYNFNKEQCKQIVDRFLNREYKSNGEGGLFPMWNCDVDMRKAEIWYQMQAWIEEKFDF